MIESAKAWMIMLSFEVFVDIAVSTSFHANAMANMHTIAAVTSLAQLCYWI